MIVIDLFGFPGSGKSTLAFNLYNELRKNNYKVTMLNKNEYLKNVISKKKKLDYLRLFLPRNIYYYFKIVRKCVKNIKNESLKIKIWKKIRLVLLHDQIYKKTNFDFIIIDQGIIQDFAEITLNNKDILDSDIKNYITSFLGKNKIFFVNCNISLEETKSRIKKRNRKKYSFDFLSNKELDCFLNLEKQRIDLIQSFALDYFQIINVNMQCEVLENTKKIIKIIEEDK